MFTFSMKSLILKMLGVFGCLVAVLPAFANIPGGGTGTGPNVTLVDNLDGTVTMANGIVSIVITKADATIHQINYTYNNSSGPTTTQLLAGGHNGGQLYWELGGFGSGTFTYTLVANPANNGGNYAEISLLSTSATNGTMEVHFSMLRGSTGFYVTAIWKHRNVDVAMGMGETRDNIYAGAIFNWMSVDAARNRLMEVSPSETAVGVFNAPAEVSLWTSGIYSGQYEDKYCYSADLGVQRVWGWSSVGSGGANVGLWNVSASAEYYNGGPMKRELMEHIGTTILNMHNGSHYGGGTDGSWTAGEVWTRVYGPYFIYCNNITNTITDSTQASSTLYADAQAQAAAEQTAWPYSWFTNVNYAPATNRGTVTGTMVIADSSNPNASAANLWVGVVQQPSTTDGVYDFQEWMKPYQFWVKTDTNGNFTIPDVIAGANYTLYAFGPGAAGTFQSQAQTGGGAPNTLDIPGSPFSVTVTGGATNNLGTVTWTPTRVGPTVFEIGCPNRTGDKFRHGDDYWVGDIGPSSSAPSPIWSKHLEYPFEFPSGPNYVVGQSRWTTDWNYVQPIVTDSAGNFNGSTSTITFNLPSAPAGGSQASFYIALSSDYQGPLIIQVNGNNIAGNTGYFPAYSSSGNGSDTTIRQGIHGCYSDNRFTFSSSVLHAGLNTITINMRKGGYFANHAMYDYIRLELTGYVPPAPAGVAAYAGNNSVLPSWPVTPGATSYNILRTTTSGSGYTPVTNGVIGPVCGSGTNNATYLDTSAVNGTTYYYVVQSVNPAGTSGNSPESPGVAPSGSVSTTAPATPTGLSVIIGHGTVNLTWTASPGANYYTIQRSTIVNNGAGAYVRLGIITLNNATMGTSYTDTTPTDGSTYSYFVSATSAAGTSSNSAPVMAKPVPAPPSALGTLTASPLQATNITLNWSAAPGAVGYVIQRATSVNGSYTLLGSITELTYTDRGINSNGTYYYKVTAVNAGGTSANALTTTKPAPPASLTAVAGNAQVTLTWPASIGATGYVLKRGPSSGNETNTVVTGVTATNYTDVNLTNGITYYYVVAAIGTAATSGNSPEASATPALPAPPTITQFTVAGGNFSLIGSGGIANSNYYVLASSNLTLPSAQWMRVATNQFDAGGHFALTNAINSNWPQTFYRLQLP
jgi:fibronectin type 3 domain-containing protein